MTAVGAVAAAGLAAATLGRFGLGAVGATWVLAQLLLVFVACVDVATRRIPNRVTGAAAAAALVLRAAFIPGSLAEALAAGAIAFAAFLALVLATRGGLGMGDVKLAGLLGLLLGRAVLPALFVGVLAGGAASAAVLLARRRGRRDTIAYGPYLCLGAALAILAFAPPALV